MDTMTGFIGFLVLTVALLGAAVLTGRAGKRRVHLSLVASTLVALGITIFYAEQLGNLYDLETAGFITPLHLTLAKITVVAYFVPIISGWMTFRGREDVRPFHAKAAYAVLALTVATLITGTAMVLMSERLPVPPETTPASVPTMQTLD